MAKKRMKKKPAKRAAPARTGVAISSAGMVALRRYRNALEKKLGEAVSLAEAATTIFKAAALGIKPAAKKPAIKAKPKPAKKPKAKIQAKPKAKPKRVTPPTVIKPAATAPIEPVPFVEEPASPPLPATEPAKLDENEPAAQVSDSMLPF